MKGEYDELPLGKENLHPELVHNVQTNFLKIQ